MVAPVRPRDVGEVAAAIRAARGAGAALELVGHGSRRDIGRPDRAALPLDLSGLGGILTIDPVDRLVVVRAGTALADLDAALAEAGFMLPFEPLRAGPLFGRPAARGTIGGAVAANAAGPRALVAGAPRAAVLGVCAMTGEGETIRADGRMRGTPGMAMARLLAGSWGMLAAMTDLTVRIVPLPETATTLLALGIDEFAAQAAMAAARAAAPALTGAAYLPVRAAVHLSELAASGAGRAVLALRLEGRAEALAPQRNAVESALTRFGGELVWLAVAETTDLWREVRDVRPFQNAGAAALWRITVPPAAVADLLARLAASGSAVAFCDRAGALVWAAMPGLDPHAWELRTAVAAVGGRAFLLRATAKERARVPIRDPDPPPLAALARQVRAAFDPAHVFGPDRLSEDGA